MIYNLCLAEVQVATQPIQQFCLILQPGDITIAMNTPKMQLEDKPVFSNQCVIKVYFRFEDRQRLEKIQFENIEESYNSVVFNYIVGIISLEELFKHSDRLAGQNIFLAEIS